MSEPAAPSLGCYELSDDGMTLVIKRPAPEGTYVVTLYRQPHAGPFTDADIDAELKRTAETVKSGRMQPGQRNRADRFVTRFGTLWTDLMTGPPTWWLPKARREKDGTVMVGWLRLAVAVKLDRPGHKPNPEG